MKRLTELRLCGEWRVSFWRKVCLRTPIKVASLNFHVRQSSPLLEIIVLTVLMHYMKALLYKNDHCHLNFWSDFVSDTTWSRNPYDLTKIGSPKISCLTRLHKTRVYPDFQSTCYPGEKAVHALCSRLSNDWCCPHKSKVVQSRDKIPFLTRRTYLLYDKSIS